MTLGEYIKSKRIEKGMTQKELAEKLNIKTYQNIQKYERNENEPNLKIMLNLIEILNLDLKELKKIILQD